MKSQTPRDDLQSLFYLIAFLVNDMSLPWLEFENNQSGDIFKMVYKRRL